MITMDVKGITWVGNIYQKFENMCLEAEDVICEDAVKYIENQMQTARESVKKLYSEVMQDFIPPPSCGLDEKVASELHVDQYTDAGYFDKPFLGFKEKTAQVDTKQTNNDSRIDHGADNDAVHSASDDGTSPTDALFISSSRSSVRRRNFISHSRHRVGNENIKKIFGIDKNKVNRRLAATKIPDEITLAETDACTSQSCEFSNENQNHVLGDSNSTSAEVTRVASSADCWNDIENARTDQYPSFPSFTESAEDKQMNTSSSSNVLYGVPDGFSTDRTIQSDDCSYSMVVLSHPEGYKTMQQDHLKLEETCVIVTGDELKLVPKAGSDVKTNKKKKQKGFSLSKKSSRKQEYEELAVWHGKSEKVKGDCEENQKKLLPHCMSEPEWELI